MSLYRRPLTELERTGLKAHGLAIGMPSQLSDCFRLGIAWALANLNLICPMKLDKEEKPTGESCR